CLCVSYYCCACLFFVFIVFFQAEDGIRDRNVTGVQTCALPISGYDEISLMSLSSGDYSCLPELARAMVERFASRRVRISLPSQRDRKSVGEGEGVEGCAGVRDSDRSGLVGWLKEARE